MNSRYLGMTRLTCVCWSMTSETRMRYGSFVCRQGSRRGGRAYPPPGRPPPPRGPRGPPRHGCEAQPVGARDLLSPHQIDGIAAGGEDRITVLAFLRDMLYVEPGA